MDQELLAKLEGLQTIESAMEITQMKKQSTLNLLSRLKKEGYMTVKAGNRKRLYKISQKKQRKRDPGMFDIINRYSPNMKLSEWYDHQVHGKYTVEDALVDAIKTQSFRAILASLHLFKHIRDWPRLHKIAKKKDCWQQILALHELAKRYFRISKLPKKYQRTTFNSWKQLTQLQKKNFPEISEKYKVYISFNEKDMAEV